MALDITEVVKLTSSLTVLYVEDEEQIRNEMNDMLDDFFHEILLAKDGRDGLEKYTEYHQDRGHYPDIVITDINMPHCSGVEMSEEMLRQNSEQVIIVVSAHNDSDNLLKLINMGVNNYLLKPMKSEQLFQTLYRVAKRVHYKNMESEFSHKTRELNEKLNQTVSRLEEAIVVAQSANSAKDEFLAHMSHEIRTPMNAIVGLSHILEGTPLNSKQLDYVHKIRSSSNLLLGIINDILDFSKIEAGMLEIESVRFNLNDTLHNIYNMVGVKAKEKGLEVLFDVESSVPSVIKGDSLRLGQVIINLINNAVKFTNSGKIILKVRNVSSSNTENILQFEVIDSGIGMTQEQIEKLFHSFSQADSSISRKYGGSGLGLTISKQLVELMGGEIWVESEYGIGSSFGFTIETHSVEGDRDNLPPAELSKKTALIIDENQKSSDALTKILKYFQYKIIYTSNITDAKIVMESSPIDILFVDKGIMVKCDRDRIKKRDNVKIVLMERGLQLTSELSFGGIPIDARLIKPFNQETVFDVILALYHEKYSSGSILTKSDISTLRGSRIMLVEDNLVNQTVVSGLLDDTGIEIVIANDGQEALDLLENSYQDIELVLMDINMPRMDGYQATQHIRSCMRYDGLPVVALTANAMQKDFDKAIDVGMQDYLAKPINVDSFYRILLKYLPAKEEHKNRPISIDKQQTSTISIDRLMSIKELDIVAGLERVGGDEDLYLSVLFGFVDIFADAPRELGGFVERGDHQSTKQLAHNIKGAAGNIGADGIYSLMELLENILETEPSSRDVLLTVDRFGIAFRELVLSVDQMREDPSDTKPQISQIDLDKILSKIVQKAGRRKAVECKRLAIELQGYRWPQGHGDALEEIVALLKEYRFKEAVGKIEEMG